MKFLPIIMFMVMQSVTMFAGDREPLVNREQDGRTKCGFGKAISSLIIVGGGVAAIIKATSPSPKPSPSCIVTKPEQEGADWRYQCNIIWHSKGPGDYWEFGPTCEALNETFPAIKACGDGNFRFVTFEPFCRRPSGESLETRCYNNSQVMRDFPIECKAREEGKQCPTPRQFRLDDNGALLKLPEGQQKLRGRMARLKQDRARK